MAKRPAKFTREHPSRPLKKLFLIATEGKETEPDYFNIIESLVSDAVIIKIFPARTGQNSPRYVLKRLNQELHEIGSLNKNDEAWIVIDRDQWPVDMLCHIYQQAVKKKIDCAMSNPCFELWLLLHFEPGSIDSAQTCTEKLKQHLPNYNKKLDKHTQAFNLDNIQAAINSARSHYHSQQNSNSPDTWVTQPGITTVYKLVENLLNTR